MGEDGEERQQGRIGNVGWLRVFGATYTHLLHNASIIIIIQFL